MVADLVRERQPYIFLIGATPVGRDLAPRIASAVQVGLTADCTDLQIGDYTLKKENRTVQGFAVPDPPGLWRQPDRHHRQPQHPPADGDRARGRDAPPDSRIRLAQRSGRE